MSENKVVEALKHCAALAIVATSSEAFRSCEKIRKETRLAIPLAEAQAKLVEELEAEVAELRKLAIDAKCELDLLRSKDSVTVHDPTLRLRLAIAADAARKEQHG